MADFDAVTYAILMSKIKGLVSGIKDISLPNERTLQFTTNDDKVFNITIPVRDLIYIGDTPPDSSTTYQLWLDTSDSGTTPLNKAIISEEIVASTVIGSVTSGKKYAVGTSMEDVLRDILTSYSKPQVTITINPVEDIYDAVEDTLDKIMITAKVVKGTKAVQSVSFYIDGIEKNVVTTGVSDGGTFKYEHTFDPATNKTFTIKVTADDGTNKVSPAKTVTFIAPSFYGMIEDGMEFNEENIKALQNKELKTAKALTYDSITSPSADKAYRITFCYPASLGEITSVTDAMNFEYIQDYVVSHITMDETDYILMHEKDAGYVADYLQKFK